MSTNGTKLPTREELLGPGNKKLFPHWPDVEACMKLVEQGRRFGEYDDIEMLIALRKLGLIELADDGKNTFSPVYTNLRFRLTAEGRAALSARGAGE